MKTVDLTQKTSSLAEVLELAGDDAVLLRTPEGREFILAEVEDFEAEVQQVRQQPELLQFLDERSREKKTFSI
ncbi:MAG: hypothetical protein QOJ16_272, partial [Acidobacteriota bacterium]|nr:hypothetical protein [Acidobacteriota bacterium]